VKEFTAMGLSLDVPGFYDAPAFVEALHANPELLEHYAKYVAGRSYSPEYLERAERIIRQVGEIYHRELVRDGRLGACIDLSMVLSRVLDRLGVWNYVVKGALTTVYPPESGKPNGYYWPFDHSPAQAGHAWIFAPPFSVIDITLGQQPYEPSDREYFPDVVYAKGFSDVEVGIDDLCSLSIQLEMADQGQPIWNEGFFESRPELARFLREFKPTVVEHRGAEHRFIPVDVGASEWPLEEITALELNGRLGHEIYEREIKPLFL
jgi:hypothetical protein